MALNIVDVQDHVLEALRDAIPQKVVEQGIPDRDTVERVNGVIRPYVAIQFGDILERVSGRTLVGVRSNDYEVMVYVQAVAPDASVARRIAFGNVYDALLGLQVEGSGELRQRRGGAVWPISASNGATEAYMVATSFGLTVQMLEV